MNKVRVLLYCVVLFAVVAGTLAGCAPAAPKTLDKVVWVSPRGSLEVMDDANMWASLDQGYCKDLGIDVEMQPGPGEALAVVKLVGEGQANVIMKVPLGPKLKFKALSGVCNLGTFDMPFVMTVK